MTKSTVLQIVGVGTVAASAALLGAGVAGATPNVTGQKYGDASSAISNAGLKAVIATVVGDQLSRSDCVVTFQRDKSTAQKGNHSTTGDTVLVGLNCESQLASPTHPGNSAASPEGKVAAAAAANNH